MSKQIIKKIEEEQLKDYPEFRTGDTVVVKVKVTEGPKDKTSSI